jgi:hypothetical protein
MKNRARTQIRPQGKEPDRTKCEDQRSRELRGKSPGDRGMCEKESVTQGSE